MGVPKNRWFRRENPMKMDDDWGYPHFRKPPKTRVPKAKMFWSHPGTWLISSVPQIPIDFKKGGWGPAYRSTSRTTHAPTNSWDITGTWCPVDDSLIVTVHDCTIEYERHHWPTIVFWVGFRKVWVPLLNKMGTIDKLGSRGIKRSFKCTTSKKTNMISNRVSIRCNDLPEAAGPRDAIGCAHLEVFWKIRCSSVGPCGCDEFDGYSPIWVIYASFDAHIQPIYQPFAITSVGQSIEFGKLPTFTSSPIFITECGWHWNHATSMNPCTGMTHHAVRCYVFSWLKKKSALNWAGVLET